MASMTQEERPHGFNFVVEQRDLVASSQSGKFKTACVTVHFVAVSLDARFRTGLQKGPKQPLEGSWLSIIAAPGRQLQVKAP